MQGDILGKFLEQILNDLPDAHGGRVPRTRRSDKGSEAETQGSRIKNERGHPERSGGEGEGWGQCGIGFQPVPDGRNANDRRMGEPDGMSGLRAGDANRFCPPTLHPGQAGSLSHSAATVPVG